MQRLPLTDPRIAAALMAVGVDQRCFHIEPLHHTKTGEKKTSWYVESGDVASIVELLRLASPEHPKALWRSDPNHPFLAALAGIENHARLEAFLAHPDKPPGVTRAAPNSKILKLCADYTDEFYVERPEVGTRGIHDAAALIAAGFPVFYALNGDGIFGFSSHSLTMPELTAAQCMEAAAGIINPGSIALPQLPGFPAGRHPFFYALSACLNLRLLAPAEAAAWKAPTHFMAGAGGRCAIVNDAVLKRRGFADQLKAHLAGA